MSFILSSPSLQLKFSYLSIIVKLTCVANKSYYTRGHGNGRQSQTAGRPTSLCRYVCKYRFYYASVGKRVLLPIMYKVAYIGGVNNTDY